MPTRLNHKRLTAKPTIWSAALLGMLLSGPALAASLTEGAAPASKCVQVTVRSETIDYRNRCSFHIWFHSLYEDPQGTRHHQGYLAPRDRLTLPAAELDVRVPVRLGAYRNSNPGDNRLRDQSPAYQAASRWSGNLLDESPPLTRRDG